MPTTRFQSGCPTMPGLWLALALLAGGIYFPSRAAAQDPSWQDDPPPDGEPCAVQQAYPDDELPSRTVAASDETPAIPAVPGSVTSPSSQPAPKRRAAAEAVPAEGDLPALYVSSVALLMAVEEGSPMAPGGAVRKSRRAGHGQRFRLQRPSAPRDPLQSTVVQQRVLLWWAKGGETPALLTTSPGATAQAQAGVLGQVGTSVLFGDQELNTGLHAAAPACRSACGSTAARNRVWSFPTWSWARTTSRTATRTIRFWPGRSSTSRPGPGFAVDRLSQRLQRHIHGKLHGEFRGGRGPLAGGPSCMAATGGSTFSPDIVTPC